MKANFPTMTTRIFVIWVWLVLALMMQVATSPLTAHQHQEAVEYNHTLQLPRIIPSVPRRSTSINVDKNNNTTLPTTMVGNWFQGILLWFSEMIHSWKLYWWPPIITTDPITITVPSLLGNILLSSGNNTNNFEGIGSKVSINISDNIPSSMSSSSSMIHSQSVVHSIVLQAGGPTGQPSRQPTRQPTGRPSRHPSSQPSRQPSSRPSRPSGQPSRQPTRYENYLYIPLPTFPSHSSHPLFSFSWSQ